MNISSTISHDSQYPKSDSADINIKQKAKQSEPVIKEKSSSKENISKAREKQSVEDVIDIVNKSNKEFKAFDRRLEISIHSKTKEVIVKVIDTITDEVIREIPAEKVLDTVAYRKEMSGILIDKKI